MVAIAAALAAVAFLLFLFLTSLGDSDLPPYDTPFPGERAGWTVWGVMSWPLVVTALLLGGDPHFVFWPPLMFLGGLFWAEAIEAAAMMKRTRKV